MKCPHCGKKYEENIDPESPKALLYHIKNRIHQNELQVKLRLKRKEQWKGEDQMRQSSLKKWRAWEKWVQAQIENETAGSSHKEQAAQ